MTNLRAITPTAISRPASNNTSSACLHPLRNTLNVWRSSGTVMVDEQAIHFYVVVSASDSGTLDFIQDQWNNCYNHPFASAYHRSFERIDYAI
jgi:hypothetical protein